MTILLNIYHIVGILVSLGLLSGGMYKVLQLRLRQEWAKDVEHALVEIKQKVSSESINKSIDSRVEMIKHEMDNLKQGQDELKQMMRTMQEAVISIQLGITELKPRLDNLERRVDKIESRVEHAADRR